ncbi:MAG: multidrug efflux system membrane fusion protein [Candidatus Pelagisphaera sp.]|jgi:multidrug efflux system membrane fusion protein
MKRFFQYFVPIAFMTIGYLFFRHFIASAPEPRSRPSINTTPEVVARKLQTEDYAITLHSQGTVRARTTSNLIPEVRGRIINIAANFREGEFFEEGDVLLEIDDSDYQTELIVADANLAQAELREFEESARFEQAKLDWARLNPGQEANPLTLREPQMKQAKASTASAAARVENAKRNLERTKIKAPFAGRILTKMVDVGQYVSPGNQLARVFAVDFAEVRLPLTATQYSFLDLPSIYRGENASLREGPTVTLKTTVGGTTHEWRGRIVREDGSVDTKSRQLFVVAQIRNPYGRTQSGRPPLKVGSFVQAEITGKTLAGVYVIPRVLLRENEYVLLVDGENYLERKSVNVAWETDDVIVVDKGLSAGDKLCLTEVPFALEGWPVHVTDESGLEIAAVVDESAPARARPPRPQAGGGLGDMIDGLLALGGDKLPADLKGKLVSLKESGDRSKMRPVMGEFREWAEANGVEMPAGGPGGGGGRGGR